MPANAVRTRPSRKGNYIAVDLELTVQDGDQVKAVYRAMKTDKRLKWFL